MFKRLGAGTLIGAVIVLAGCSSSSQPFNPNATSPSAGRSSLPTVSPDKDCGSAGHVVVTPCPVKLTKHTKHGIIVTVSGPKVVSSDLGSIKSCFNAQNCYNAQRYGSSQTQWLITSGSSCSGADVEFDGFNAHGQRTGYFFLEVKNKYCP
ncbi:MAG: hypothetical protein WB757_05270 [Candidatus Cybelea sp.]|jgi:hypothetical protein